MLSSHSFWTSQSATICSSPHEVSVSSSKSDMTSPSSLSNFPLFFLSPSEFFGQIDATVVGGARCSLARLIRLVRLRPALTRHVRRGTTMSRMMQRTILCVYSITANTHTPTHARICTRVRVPATVKSPSLNEPSSLRIAASSRLHPSILRRFATDHSSTPRHKRRGNRLKIGTPSSESSTTGGSLLS